MSQAKRTIKTEKDNSSINNILDYYCQKYNLSKGIFFNSIDAEKYNFKVDQFNITTEKIDNEIEALNMNANSNNTTMETIKKAINNIIDAAEKENIENEKIRNKTNQKKNNNNEKMKILLSESHAVNKKNPAKTSIIIDNNINVKYNTALIYNDGKNEMERQFNKINPEFNENILQIINPYNLLPKDSSGQTDGYQKYFFDIKEKYIKEQKLEEDTLWNKTKFILFLAFDVIDAKPTFDDLVGIDPLDDFKKYVLKINTNNDNLFFVSGEIIFIEGDLVDNGKTIEVRDFKHLYEIKEYNIDNVNSTYYSNDSQPYALYYMNGPYFPKDNIDFSVFNNVIKQVVNKNPHFFIVNGPFFSSENEKVKWGAQDTEEGMIEIINILKKEFKETRTKILICPGISDNENFYPLPQPPFDKINNNYRNTKIGTNGAEIIFISNPQIFPLNEAYIGVANFDTIKDIIFNSVHSPLINTVDKACEMILHQKNFYPILPNTIQQQYENNTERIITVDLSQYKYLYFGNYESPPDIILTNSIMKNFAKNIRGTVFVNCGSFCKGKNYGEIAKITLHKASNSNEINKRLKVEFIKINPNINDIKIL